jgi:hypothetical protein
VQASQFGLRRHFVRRQTSQPNDEQQMTCLIRPALAADLARSQSYCGKAASSRRQLPLAATSLAHRNRLSIGTHWRKRLPSHSRKTFEKRMRHAPCWKLVFMPTGGTHARIHYFIVSLCLAGCAQSSATREDTKPHAPAQPPSDRERCQRPQTEADQLLDDAQVCTTDSDCSLAQSIDALCLDAFLCPVPVSRTADLDPLRSEAQQLSTEYRGCTSQCAVADCGAAVGAPSVCNSMTKRCQVQFGSTAEPEASGQHD